MKKNCKRRFLITILGATISLLVTISGCSSSNQVSNVRLYGDILHWDSTAGERAGFNVERRVYRDGVFVTTETISIWAQRSLNVNDFKFIEGDWTFRVRRIRTAFPSGDNIYQEWSSTYVDITPQIPSTLFAPFIQNDGHKLHWLSVPRAETYEIRRRIPRTNHYIPWTFSWFINADTLEVALSEIKASNAPFRLGYQIFEVRAVEGSGDERITSNWSNEITVPLLYS